MTLSVSVILILIIFSGFGLALIVSLKISEIRSGVPGLLAKLSDFSDSALKRKLESGKFFLGYANRTNARKVLGAVAGKLFHVFGTVGLFVSKRHASFMLWIKGRKFFKSRGVVSFFLKNVAESKGEEKGE